MDDLVLRAEPRSILGKKVKQLRRRGLIPGVVYGPVVPAPLSVSVDERVFSKFFAAHGHATLLTLTMDSGDQPVFIHDVQVDPVRHNPLHIDFFAPNLRQALNAMVPVALHNPAQDAEGVLTTMRTEIEVRGLPTDIPPQVDGDLSSLVHVGDALRVSDLLLPPGVVSVTDEEEVIAVLSAEEAPEPVETEEEAEEAEAAAEGEAGIVDESQTSESASPAEE
ncbi:MAG TPA: 50S ribosomal protein L25 [Thermomicrobiales bacterium]|nr:50S ribosomal protein L25 [Thermomicrobiales bacterium]